MSLFNRLFQTSKVAQEPQSSGYTSNELFHFVGLKSAHDDEKNYSTLLKVIDSEHVSHWPHEKGFGGGISYAPDWDKGQLVNETLIVPTVTCFCEIPLNHLGIHIFKYGKFGLSFTKQYLMSFHARPVLYIPIHNDPRPVASGADMLKDWEAIWRGAEDLLDQAGIVSPTRRLGSPPQTINEALAVISDMVAREFFAFMKPFNPHLPDDHPDNYYLEREWRRYGNLPFTADTVFRVVVARGFAKRLKVDRPTYASRVCEV